VREVPPSRPPVVWALPVYSTLLGVMVVIDWTNRQPNLVHYHGFFVAQLELDERPADELQDELPNYDS
jgi:hypothetical protein